MTGLATLHAGLCYIAQRYNWEIVALGESPKADRSNIHAYLSSQQSPISVGVFGGHGVPNEAGIVIAREMQVLQTDQSQRASLHLEPGHEGQRGEIWKGIGANFDSLDILVLVACAVGRLQQNGYRDVESFYAELLARQCRCVLSARWPIADNEAAVLVVSFINAYLSLLKEKQQISCNFLRARALNRTRHMLHNHIRHSQNHPLLTDHLVQAFEIYGLG
jgi:hypothetical protein